MTVYQEDLAINMTFGRSILNKYEFNSISNDDSFDNFLKLAKIICDAPVAYISILDDENQYVLAQDGIELKTMSIADSFCQYTLDENKIVIIEDSKNDKRTKNLPLVNQNKPIAFYAGYPLVDNEENNLGAFCIMDYHQRKLNHKQQEALKLLSNQVVKSFNTRKELFQSLKITHVDTTDRYQKEEDLRRQLILSNKKLRANNIEIEEKYSQLKTFNLKLLRKSLEIESIIDALPACVSCIDLQYCYQLTNKVYEDWFGFSQKELKGEHVSYVLGDEGFKALRPYYNKVFNGETVRYETRVNVNGERHIRVTYLPSYDYLGKINGAFIFTEDLTDIKRYQEELEISNKSLESFASIVSHDIKSSLKTITGFSTLLKHELDGKSVLYNKVHLDYIVQSAKRLESLTTDLLSYAKVQNDKVDIHNGCSIQNTLKIVLDNLHISIKASNAILNFDKTDARLALSENHLIQLLQNIISNGIKYQEKQNQPIINISIKKNEPFCSIILKDNGIGIKKEDLEKIFQPFTRINHDYPGTGIGLAICQKIVDKYDSVLKVKSGLGKGSTFSFSLPILL